MSRFLPHPMLTIMLLVIWLFLVNAVTLGTVLLGTIIGVAIPNLTRAYWPDSPTLRRPFRFTIFVLIVIWDIIIANFVVAWKVLFRSNASLSPRWISVPVDLTRPEAITILAGTITLTPGTVTSDMSSGGRALLVHCLDETDPDAAVAQIKQRYERRLKEIFE